MIVETPFIADLLPDGTALFAGGAERFGAVLPAAAQKAAPLVQQLLSLAPAGGLAALARRSSFAGLVMDGYDALVMVNLTGDALEAPGLLMQTSGVGGQLQLLASGGWATSLQFGGSGNAPLTSLDSNGLYLTFVPTGTAYSSFGLAAGGVVLSATGNLLLDSAAAYLSSTPVPEPASLALMACGVAALLARRRLAR